LKPKPVEKRAETGSTALSSWQWTNGGKRKKISGALPAYPAGVTATAQIKMEVMVAPNGHVRSVRPAQRGNTHFEEAASRELRKWRFEPLPRSFPQRDQRCLVIINFSLR
jgi:TonB family protein